jgi:hypothetical protein
MHRRAPVHARLSQRRVRGWKRHEPIVNDGLGIRSHTSPRRRTEPSVPSRTGPGSHSESQRECSRFALACTRSLAVPRPSRCAVDPAIPGFLMPLDAEKSAVDADRPCGVLGVVALMRKPTDVVDCLRKAMSGYPYYSSDTLEWGSELVELVHPQRSTVDDCPRKRPHSVMMSLARVRARSRASASRQHGSNRFQSVPIG